MSLAGSNRKPALTAAASKIRFSRSTVSNLKDAPWQDRAWNIYDALPAAYYMTHYRASIARKMDYFAAVRDPTGEDPDADEGQASKVLEAEGGPELLRRIVSEFIVYWDVPGEGYLTRWDEEPLWRALSTQELKKSGGFFMWGDEETDMGTIDADNVYRVWKAHPRFHWQADSPTRHVLDDAEELILSGREVKARGQSRLSAGILWIPDGVDMSPFGSDEEGDEDDFARELTQRMTRPIRDPGSADSLVPWVITANKEDIAAVKHTTFERDWDISIDLRRELLGNVAMGLDMPPAMGTGDAASSNHWGAWWLSDEAVNMHVLPTVDDILDSLTTNWFRPLLQAAGVASDQIVLWRDPSPATVPPDRSDIAIRLFVEGAISGAAVRRVTDFDEEDAPTPEELEQRVQRSSEGVPTEGPPVQASIDPDFLLQVAEAVRRLQEGDPPLAEAAVTAAVRRRIVATELADIDADLLTWCQEKADAEIERILGIVGKSLTAATDPLDESLLTRLAAQLDAKIAEAQAAARVWVESLTAKPIDPEPESAFRSQGIQVIIGGILEAVRRRLFTPGASPDPIDTGRIPTVTTPTAAIRQGLSVAGGGPAIYEDGKTSELVGNGQHIHDELEDEGFFQDGYEWKYGHPANTFEPHLHLDGKQFTSWDDPQLAVNFGDSWLRRSHYAPGDHKGCCCAFIQVITQDLFSGPVPSGGRPDELLPSGPPLTWEQFGIKLPTDPARRKLLNDALQRLNALPPGVRDRYIQLMGQFDGGVNFKVATASTKSLSEIGKVTYLTNRQGVLQPHGRKLMLHLSRPTEAWDEWVVRHNAEFKLRASEIRTTGESHGEVMAKWKLSDPEPERWRLATPDELADTLVHELGHQNDLQHFFDAPDGFTMTGHLDEATKNRVWEMYWGGPRGSRNPVNAAYEYAKSSPQEMVAELQKFYLRGVNDSGLNLTAVEWRMAHPELARWVEENLLP